MAKLRYVCLSDTHFGEEDNILTNLKEGSYGVDPTRPSPALEKLVTCLKHLIENTSGDQLPTLILNGDILELALCTTNDAAMAFDQFIGLVMKEGEELFDDIVYIPGNHDHHLWETARETQYINHLKMIKPGEVLEVPRHTTRLLPDNQKIKVPSVFLTNLIERYEHLRGQGKTIDVYYPNFGIKGEDGKRCVIFTHGHFIEPVYTLMTTLRQLIFPGKKTPQTIDNIEAENFAWIDFFWSTMGRSGKVGKSVEAIYEHLQYVKGIETIVENLSENLADRFDLPGFGDWMESKILKSVLQRILRNVQRTERKIARTALGFEAEEGFEKYVTGPLLSQLKYEIHGEMPTEVTVVFGHTHKPFQTDMQRLSGYPQWVNVYNTGGWVVETIAAEPRHGGAVVLIDEDLNATSLRMYNEADDDAEYKVAVEEARHGGEASNPFHEDISKFVNPNDDPWKSFSRVVAQEVRERAKNLHARIKKYDYTD